MTATRRSARVPIWPQCSTAPCPTGVRRIVPAMATEAPSRDELAAKYLDQLPYTPYPVQEEALLAWFTSDEGLMVCAPTGTGKTVIAEAALFEALHTGKTAYYTTPLIALTEQKFREMQAAAVRWGFSAEDVGLVTGNRTVNGEARILVVVAEILLNRLLHAEAFDFADVAHGRDGRVPQLCRSRARRRLGAVAGHASAARARAAPLGHRRECGRVHRLAQPQSRSQSAARAKHRAQSPSDLPLGSATSCSTSSSNGWQTERDGRGESPALVFCFNRDECWSVAEQLKGKSLLADGQQKRLVDELAKHDWSKGAGPKLKQILQRGVGIHHAGILPKYRRIVEELFQRKLLSVCVCTETLAAGINLPARSVVLTTLVKGPPGKKKLIDPSSAHQMFGRAGRPQFDTQGYVYALAHEDDVKILRFKERINQIPENTKDPLLDPGAQEARKTDAHAEQDRKILGGRPFRETEDGSARQALQQGATSLAASGLPARNLSRRRAAAVGRSQTLDGRAADRSGTKALSGC